MASCGSETARGFGQGCLKYHILRRWGTSPILLRFSHHKKVLHHFWRTTSIDLPTSLPEDARRPAVPLGCPQLGLDMGRFAEDAGTQSRSSAELSRSDLSKSPRSSVPHRSINAAFAKPAIPPCQTWRALLGFWSLGGDPV